MTPQEIVKLAEDKGFCVLIPDAGYDYDALWFDANLIEFANAIAAAEREACAKVCEDGVASAQDWDSSYWDQACQNRAHAIRARTNTP